MKIKPLFYYWAGLLTGLFATGLSHANTGNVHVAVASNFARPMQAIAKQFAAETGYQPQLSFGASGKFVAQIMYGAPFEVFLSADRAKPEKLVQLKLADADSVFTYARGRLVLWSAREGYIDDQGNVLKTGNFKHLALADPKLAPYGMAAIQVLQHQQLLDTLKPRFVMGENISQAFQFVKTGNATLGFVAWSQIKDEQNTGQSSSWLIPETYHDPIEQQAVLLNKGLANPGAQALMAYLQTHAVQTMIHDFGYAQPLTLTEDDSAHADR